MCPHLCWLHAWQKLLYGRHRLSVSESKVVRKEDHPTHVYFISQSIFPCACSPSHLVLTAPPTFVLAAPPTSTYSKNNYSTLTDCDGCFSPMCVEFSPRSVITRCQPIQTRLRQEHRRWYHSILPLPQAEGTGLIVLTAVFIILCSRNH